MTDAERLEEEQLQWGADLRYLRGLVRAYREHGCTVFQPTNMEALEKLLAAYRALEAERDKWREAYEAEPKYAASARQSLKRAEAAEAARDHLQAALVALRQQVAQLAEKWTRLADAGIGYVVVEILVDHAKLPDAFRHCATELRALLWPEAAATREAE